MASERSRQILRETLERATYFEAVQIDTVIASIVAAEEAERPTRGSACPTQECPQFRFSQVAGGICFQCVSCGKPLVALIERAGGKP